MRIAIVAHNKRPVVQNSPFGVEIHIYNLISELIKRKHQITLFASQYSKVPCELVSLNIEEVTDKIPQDKIEFYEDWLNLEAFLQSDKFDIIHCHNPLKSVFFSFLTQKPTLSVIHDAWKTATTNSRYPTEIFENLCPRNPRHWMITVSEYQRKLILPFIPQTFAIYNGIDIKKISCNNSNNNEYLFFIGRVNKRKGIEKAIEVGINTNRPLKIAGYAEYDFEKLYLNNIINNTTKHNKIEFLGAVVDLDAKYQLMANAKLLLFPIQWEEPFGQVMVESMATGTPVIAFARGSVPEIVKDGETGFIINSSDMDIRGDWIVKKTGIDGLYEAVEKVYSLPLEKYQQMRRNCRKHVEENFTVEKMVDNYEKIYGQILSNRL